MTKSTVKWIALLAALTVVTWACKKEEKTEEMKAPAQMEQKAPAQTEEKAMQTPPAQEGMKPATEGAMVASQGQEVYEKNCAACHAEGVAGAPKVGDMEAWSSLIAKGADMLTESAINGIGTMPPKGGNPSLSDEDIRAAVSYMIEKSQ